MLQRIGTELRPLTDLSFRTHITPRLVQILYILGVLAIGWVSLGLIAGAFAASPAAGFVTLLVGAPLVFLLGTAYLRVVLETLLVLFRLAEVADDVALIRRRLLDDEAR